jgi:hypothetical protein
MNRTSPRSRNRSVLGNIRADQRRNKIPNGSLGQAKEHTGLNTVKLLDEPHDIIQSKELGRE